MECRVQLSLSLSLSPGCIAQERVPADDAGQPVEQSSGDVSSGPSEDTAEVEGSGGEPDERPPQQPGHMATRGDAIPSEPTCDTGPACCPPGTVAIMGTQSADVLTGSSPNRCWVALGGNDQVTDNSSAGSHALLGGPGVDTLQSGGGPAIAAGGTGKDSITTLGSSDELYGQGDDDWLSAGSGDDRLFGGAGADALYGGGNDDILYGGAGNDKLYGEPGHDFLIGGPGADQVYGGSGGDTLLVYDLCELASGEILDGGTDTDLLYIHGRTRGTATRTDGRALRLSHQRRVPGVQGLCRQLLVHRRAPTRWS